MAKTKTKESFSQPGERFAYDLFKRNDHAKMAFLIAAMEMGLADLSIHADRIETEAKRIQNRVLRQERKNATRAVVKRLMAERDNGTLTDEKVRLARDYINKHLSGTAQDHDQSEHDPTKNKAQFETERALAHHRRGEYLSSLQHVGAGFVGTGADGFKAVFGSIGGWFTGKGREGEEGEAQDVFNRTARGLTESGEKVGRMADGMQAFFSKQQPGGVGQRIVNLAKYITGTGTNAAAAATVIRDYGPFVGRRMLANYGRYGGFDVPIPKPGEEGGPPKNATKNQAIAWAKRKLRKNLPSQDEAELAGHRMPSEGFIVSSDGEILAHAIGRKGDHFTPFNMRHIATLWKNPGSEIVRRRVWGGPTVEDLHLGMMFGANKIHTISNAGEFVVSLSDRAKGMTTEHFQLLARYQGLLNQHEDEKDFDAYDNSLGALALEFPLHMSKDRSRKGPWSDQHDRQAPMTTLVEEISDMFSGLSTKVLRTDQAQRAGQAQRAAPGTTDTATVTTFRGPGGLKVGPARDFIGGATSKIEVDPDREGWRKFAPAGHEQFKTMKEWEDSRRQLPGDKGTRQISHVYRNLGWLDENERPTNQTPRHLRITQPSAETPVAGQVEDQRSQAERILEETEPDQSTIEAEVEEEGGRYDNEDQVQLADLIRDQGEREAVEGLGYTSNQIMSRGEANALIDAVRDFRGDRFEQTDQMFQDDDPNRFEQGLEE